MLLGNLHIIPQGFPDWVAYVTAVASLCIGLSMFRRGNRDWGWVFIFIAVAGVVVAME